MTNIAITCTKKVVANKKHLLDHEMYQSKRSRWWYPSDIVEVEVGGFVAAGVDAAVKAPDSGGEGTKEHEVGVDERDDSLGTHASSGVVGGSNAL